MTERDGPPEPLDAGLEDLLAEFRDADVLPEDARQRIWETVGADEPPRRRFVPPPPATATAGRRWTIGAVVAVAAATLLWLGLGDRLTADETERDARRDAAAMVEHDDATPNAAVEREAASTRSRVRAPEPELDPVEPPSAPLEPNAPVESEAGVAKPESIESPESRKPSKSRPRPEQTEPEPVPSPSSTLAEEQRMVGKAWSALTAGNPEGAMTIVRAHAKQFPSGVLAPERDAVSAIARCRISPDASTSILAAFRGAHASSPLASRVSKACTGGEKKSPAP